MGHKHSWIWNDFMALADNYWTQVREWTNSGKVFGDFCWGQPRDPPRPEEKKIAGIVQTAYSNNTMKLPKIPFTKYCI